MLTHQTVVRRRFTAQNIFTNQNLCKSKLTMKQKSESFLYLILRPTSATFCISKLKNNLSFDTAKLV